MSSCELSHCNMGPIGINYMREGTPGRHEPLQCRHEPPRVARQTKPPLCRNEHAQHIKMCLCNTEGFFKLVF